MAKSKRLMIVMSITIYATQIILNFDLPELPGIKVETEIVEEELQDSEWTTNLFLKETALKEVDNPGILHIATHGFFLKQQSNPIALSSRHNPPVDDNALLRSGLLMTGATQSVQGQHVETVENGIFTAYEAMNLDLSSTELVVLSACETELGDIKNGEGVFGLQRAFQIAGTQSILMSLWKVDDEATQLLMTSFYEKWRSGTNETKALDYDKK